jgi:signal transduction histidine kinase
MNRPDLRGIPLRWRLTMAFAGGMAVVIAGFGAFLYLRTGAELLRGVDMDLRARAAVVVTALREGRPAPLDAGRGLIDPDESFAQVLDGGDGRVVTTTAAVAGAPMLDRGAVAAARGPTFVSGRVRGVDDPVRLLAVPTRDVSGRRLVVVVGAPLGDRAEALSRLRWSMLLGGPAALALASAAGWLLAGTALRPVERMRREAAAISASEPDRRLAVPGTGDELTRLARTLNDLLDRLGEALGRERRFVDDASHELRTPLAILKVELDLALSRPRAAGELVDTLRSASEETDRLVRLAEDLLVLARSRPGRLPLRRTPVSLPDLLGQAASAYPATVAAEDVTVTVDPVGVRQAVRNLVDNAYRHGGGDGGGDPVVTVTARTVDGVLRIDVEDDGPGFPPDFLDRAFEPFARGGRQGEAGDTGAGLGLAIVKAVAESHGGQATVDNRGGGGARATLLLALAP